MLPAYSRNFDKLIPVLLMVSKTACNSSFGVGVATCFCLPTSPNLFLAIRH